MISLCLHDINKVIYPSFGPMIQSVISFDLKIWQSGNQPYSWREEGQQYLKTIQKWGRSVTIGALTHVCYSIIVSNCCLTPTQLFFSYIMARTNLFSMLGTQTIMAKPINSKWSYAGLRGSSPTHSGMHLVLVACYSTWTGSFEDRC